MKMEWALNSGALPSAAYVIGSTNSDAAARTCDHRAVGPDVLLDLQVGARGGGE